jgi:hypothetical protein
VLDQHEDVAEVKLHFETLDDLGRHIDLEEPVGEATAQIGIDKARVARSERLEP